MNNRRSGFVHHLIVLFAFLFSMEVSWGQKQPAADTALTLDDCISYALKHQPALNQSLINTAIVRTTNSIALSGWLPQVSVAGNLTHYNTLPTSFVNSNGTILTQKTGVVNTFGPTLTATQTIFNPSLLYAAKSAHLYVEQAQQITDSTKINIVAGVSKTFYSLLLTLQQIDVLREDTARLNKNLHDTYHQYVSGIVDETDYDEAKIELNNSMAQLKQAEESITPQYATLKQVMGFPPQDQFNVLYDTARMTKDIDFDTAQALQYEKRIEFQQIQTDKRLQSQLVNYYRQAWIPTLGAFFDYDYAFQSNSFGSLFSSSYPYSYIGLSVSVPIFTGFARTNNIKKARLQYQLLDWSEVALRSEIYTEYATAMGNYKGNLYNLTFMRDNVSLAKKTYDIVYLQYQQGVVAYLNVITAESNLVSSEINYINALFQLLSSKIDLEKALGIIPVK